MNSESSTHDPAGKGSPGTIPEDIMRQFLQSASIPVMAFNHAGQVVYCSRHAAEILSLRAADAVGLDVLSPLRPRDRSVFNAHLQTVTQDRLPARCEFEMVLPDATRVWIRLVSHPGVNEDGEVCCWSSVENLNQLKRMEKTEALFQRAAAIQGSAQTMKEFATQIFDLLRILFGFENGHLAVINKVNGLIEFPFHMDQREAPPNPRKPENSITDYVLTVGRLVWLHDARSGNKVTELGFKVPDAQPTDWIGVPLLARGKVAGMIAVCSYEPGFAFSSKDIGLMLGVSHLFEVYFDRVDLMEGYQRLSAAIEQAAETVVITDRHGVILYVNPAFEKVTGYTREEVTGRTPKFLQSGKHDAVFYRQLWSVLDRGENWRGRFTNKRKDGSLYEEEAVISPVRNSDGEVVNYVAVKRDITRESSLEEQFFHAQKMDAANKLVEGISHDFRNLLMVIRQNAELLREGAQSPANSEELRQVLDAAEQSESLIRRLAAFSEKQTTSLERIEPNLLVQEFEQTAKALIGERHLLHVDLGPRVTSILVNRGQVEQALANLVMNAADALADSGGIEIRTRSGVIHEGSGEVFADPPHFVQEPFAIIEVVDSGTGVVPEAMSDIFRPGYTTRPGATGLGLSVCAEIMRRHKGYISVQANKPRGTLFTLYFPAPPVAESVALKGPEPELARGNETILLAEDEEGARRVISRMLQDQGYNVIEAENGSMAIRQLLYHQGRIDLLLSDIMMPDFDGRALADQIRGIQSDIKIVFISGYDEAHLEDTGIIQPGEPINLIKKPFRREDLVPKIRNVLDKT